jgi:hypothetical protein
MQKFRRVACFVRGTTFGLCHGEASLGEQFFHLTEAQTKTMVEPHGVTDNFGGKAMTLVAGCWLFHAAQSVKKELN